MRKALNPYVVAAVAVVGVSALAVTPVIATPADIKIVNPEVRPTASLFDVYRDAVEHVLANLQALLGSTLAGPELTGLNLELVLDGVFGEPATNFRSLRDSLERNGDDLPALLESMRTGVSDALETALVDLAAGRFDLAVGQLLSVSVYAVVQVVNLAATPVRPPLGDLGTAQALQGIAAALKSGDPDRVLNALVTAPALITDRMLNGGYKVVPGAVLGDQAWPGVLSNGLSGPVSDVVDLGLATVPLRRGFERVVTLDVDAGITPSVEMQRRYVEDPRDGQDADKGTNQDVMATDGATDAPDYNGPRFRAFGSRSTSRTGGGAGLNTLRDGVRDGIEGFRDGVRNVVKSVTGRGDSSTGSPAESP